ncbi:MAG: SPFH domain-containing protein [Chloroflexi bacterium]|nr:SPFH domain-containing protein [Chloroflexota bacterium]
MRARLPESLVELLSHIRWRVLYYATHFVDGDGDWGMTRLAAALCAIGLFVVFGRMTEALTASPWVYQIGMDAPPNVQAIARFLAGFLTREVVRHALLPAIGFIVAIRVGAAFVNDLFELNNMPLANEYLMASLFGQGYPNLEIRDGKAEPGSADNPLIKIGGPGVVDLGIGMAAVFEHCAGPSSIVGPGKHFIRRFETLREVFDLRDQYREMPEVKAMSKDGIPVTVKDVRMSFRLRAGRPRTEAEPYPYLVSALRQATYNRTVGAGPMASWADSVAGAVAGQIRAMISQRRLDELIGFDTETDPPRDQMHAEFGRAATRKKFAGMGAEILWAGLGHFETPSQVATQLIQTWRATWQYLVNVTEAEAQAERLRQREYLRGEERLHTLNVKHTRRQGGADARTDDLYFVELAETLEEISRAGPAIGQALFDDILRQARQRKQSAAAASDTEPTATSL